MPLRSLVGLLLAIGMLAPSPGSAVTAWGKRHLLCTYGSTGKNAYATEQEIISACDKLLEDEPDNIWASGWRSGRAYALARLGKCDEAITVFDELEDLKARASVVSSCKNDHQGAIADYGKAIAADPTDADALIARAQLWHRTGQPDKAEADYSAAVRTKPEDYVFYERARFYVETENYDAAMKDYAESEHLALMKPDDPSRLAALYNSRALMWRDRGDYDRALAEANKAVETYPPNGFRANRGEIWRLKGDLTKALADQTFGLKNWPKHRSL